MAYMNQEKKKQLAPEIKKVLKAYGVKGTIAVRNHSTLVVNIKSGAVDFSRGLEGRGYCQVNPYWINRHWTGTARDFLIDLRAAMMTGNHDNSDIQTDYFDVGWYIDINIGTYAKPYEHVELA